MTSATKLDPLPNSPKPLAAAALYAVSCVWVLKNAWIAEDSLITFRTIDNFVHGFGLRWNVDERVQSFTHPLWMMLNTVTYAIGADPAASTTAWSLGLVLLTWVLLMPFVRRRPEVWVPFVVVPLLFSHSVASHVASGLETPLTVALVAAFFVEVFQAASRSHESRLLRLTFVASLLALTRLDALAFVGPSLLWALVEARGTSWRRLAWAVVRGGLPLVAWLVFSTVYFGFPLPNTYYAKVSTGIPSFLYWLQGSTYFFDLVKRDVIGAAALAVGAGFLVLNLEARQARLAAWGLGCLAFSLYVLSVGGDFMSGRFWVLPIVSCLLMVGQTLADWTEGRRLGFVGLGAVVVLTALWRHDGPVSNQGIGPSGIVDERDFYEPTNYIANFFRGNGIGQHPWARQGAAYRQGIESGTKDPVVVMGNVGMFGFYAGPAAKVIDPLALTDALLARLPIDDPYSWRIGHFQRTIPDGYLASLKGDWSKLDPDLRTYDEALREITSGPVFSGHRLATMVQFWTGQFEGARRAYLEKHRHRS